MSSPGPDDEATRLRYELDAARAALRERDEQLSRLEQELEETNRGVVALYAELDARAEDLRRASEHKTAFLSTMTHEFRTPLNSMLGLSRMLLDRLDGDLTAEQETQVRLIRRAAESLSELVNDLLDLAKVEAGKVTVQAGPFEPAELFGALRGMLRPLLPPGSPVHLVFEEPEGLPTLQTDEGKVSQILRNFISNALKYTERGEVRVSARANPDGTVTFSVADTGIGIAQEDQARIFEEFVQVEHAAQRRAKGTGLGLPLSRRLAQLLGGDVSVQSRPGVGSTFRVTIPAAYPGPAVAPFAPAAPAPAPAPPADPGPASGSTILLIDDDEGSRYLMRERLSSCRLAVVEAAGGREGLDRARRLRPAAIVLDLVMPGLDGFGVLEHLAADPETREIPVIIHTSRPLDDDERADLAGRVAAILSKGRDGVSAAAELHAALGRAGLSIQGAEGAGGAADGRG